jgi:hypothetical protein
MSLRALYRRIEPKKRICSYYKCRERIQRNIDRDKDGNIYHHGCLMDAQDEEYHCLDCYSTFDATEACFTEKQQFFNDNFRVQLKPICPNCGSSNIKPACLPDPESFTVKHHEMPSGRLVECGSR